MGRRLLALSLSAVLPVGALCAPLVHAHADDHHAAHHGASRLHAHFSEHASTGHVSDHEHAGRALSPHVPPGTRSVEGDTDPERVSAVQLFVADHTDDRPSATPEPLGAALPTPLASVMRRPPEVSHAHDPPTRSAQSPRAPPAWLSRF